MYAIIYRGMNVIGFLPDADEEELYVSGSQYDMVDQVPDIILNTPTGYRVERSVDGSYSLVEIPPSPLTTEQEIDALKDENAELLLQNAMQDMTIQEIQDENAEMMFKIAMLEVGAGV